MFNKHPKGLVAAALANMGERFGFYIMMAVLTLFISAKFGLSETVTGYIYSAFYASIYILALAGGLIADKTKNFKGTILAGLVLMAVGYLIIASYACSQYGTLFNLNLLRTFSYCFR